MGKTYVYNDGTSKKVKQEDLKLEFGLFFDGTANNLYNTDARKYATYEERFDNNTLSKRGKKEILRIKTEYEKNNTFHKYTRENFITAYEENKNDVSYGNDHTNVARMYLNSERNDYAIYIEGVGTGNLKKDESNPGISHAIGVYGLIEKVRKGSKELAMRIKNLYDKEEKKGSQYRGIEITIDVFGFSRGATAARHFLFQISHDKHLETIKKEMRADNTTYWSVSVVEAEKSEFKIFLGKLLNKKIVENLKINIRFAGLYDTVASYDPEYITVGNPNPPKINIPDFKKNIHLLHLNEIGDPMLVIHFTALDEIREYFSLTRLSHSKAIEKNLPGAHSDVGGSYDCDGVNLYEKVILGQNLTHFKDLKNLKQEMIKEGWYSEGELELKDFTYPAQNELIGTRIVMGEYSYLPLLWMSKYASFLIEKKKIDFPNIKKIYNIETEEGNVLKEVKKHLKKHLKNTYNIESEDTLKKVKTYLESTTFKELTQMEDGIKNISELKTFIQKDSKVKEDWTFKSGKEQNLLKNLRHRYLHQSASYENAGGENFKYPFVEPNKPAEDRKRIEIPG